MEVSNNTNAGSGSGLPEIAAPDLGQDEFLQLLVTQLRHQDPMSPMDNTAFVSQLAEFSALEQMQLVNTNLDAQMQLIQGNTNSMSAGLIGRDILAFGNTVQLDSSGGEASIVFDLGDSADATISVLDSGGNPVRTIRAEDLSSGRNEVAWDGKNDAGEELAAGEYTYTVTAVDDAGATVSAQTYTSGTVTGIRYGNGGSVLLIGDQVVLLSEVLEINQADTADPNDSEQDEEEDS